MDDLIFHRRNVICFTEFVPPTRNTWRPWIINYHQGFSLAVINLRTCPAALQQSLGIWPRHRNVKWWNSSSQKWKNKDCFHSGLRERSFRKTACSVTQQLLSSSLKRSSRRSQSRDGLRFDYKNNKDLICFPRFVGCWGNGAKEINGFMTLGEMKGSCQPSCWAENTSQVCCALCVALFLHNLISYIINATLTLSQACGDMKAEAINSIRAISSFLSVQLLPDLLCLAGEGWGVGALINVSLWAGRAIRVDCVSGRPRTFACVRSDGLTNESRRTESRKKINK